MQTNALNEIISILERSHSVLALTHISPDGDAIGSLLGFGWLLTGAGKQVSLVEVDAVPPECRDLPGVERIRR